MSYNGWSNYETWNLALWLGNDQGSEEMWNERAAECYRDATASQSFSRREQATLDLSKELEADTEENAPRVEGFYADVLNAAISEVNWYEVAEHYINEVADEIDKDELQETAKAD